MNKLNRILARVKDKTNRYRIVKEDIEKNELYGDIRELIKDSKPYEPDTSLDNDDCLYHIDGFSNKEYCIDLIKDNAFAETTQFVHISTKDLEIVKFLITYKNVTGSDGYMIFQKVSSNKILRNKKILSFKTNNVEIIAGSNEIIISDYPDAIYSISEDRLYFKKLLNLDSIFKKISELYREATNEEVEKFLNSDFITIGEDFRVEQIKINNRKRIALVSDALNELPKDKKKKLISYTKKYCRHLNYNKGKFEISSDKDLKDLLYGIQEKYFTTEITRRKKCANSMFDIE